MTTPPPPRIHHGSVDEEDATKIRPFEWLTSPDSLHQLLAPIIAPTLTKEEQLSSEMCRDGSSNHRSRRRLQIVHVGSGSSVWGESIVEQWPDRIAFVMNIDKDVDTLNRMRQRWLQRQGKSQEEPLCSKKSTDIDSSSDRGGSCGRACVNQVHFCAWDLAQPSQRDSPNDPPHGTSITASADLILDKSTLDCTLCSDGATAHLLTQVQMWLRPVTGVYLLVTFHDPQLIRPLLEDCPLRLYHHTTGSDSDNEDGKQDSRWKWQVDYQQIERQVEDLVGGGGTVRTATKSTHPIESTTNRPHESTASGSQPTPSDTLVVDEDEDHDGRRYVHVFTVRLVPNESSTHVDVSIPMTTGDCWEHEEYDALYQRIYDHVNNVNDDWYQQLNPILTPARKQEIEEGFGGKSQPLTECYRILFTEAEREHLTFQHFCEDWDAYWRNTISASKNTRFDVIVDDGKGDNLLEEMTVATALDFLQEMQ